MKAHENFPFILKCKCTWNLVYLRNGYVTISETT